MISFMMTQCWGKRLVKVVNSSSTVWVPRGPLTFKVYFTLLPASPAFSVARNQPSFFLVPTVREPTVKVAEAMLP